MLKFCLLAFMLVLVSIPARAQSDCGNCYIAGTSCIVTLDCGDAAYQVSEIVHCDYDPCSYVVTFCSFECPNQLAQTPVQKEKRAKTLLGTIRRRNAERAKTAQQTRGNPHQAG